jgi:hypothetical protein
MFQALHPQPNPNILIPYMHGNLAQIGRTFVASCLVNSYINPDPLQYFLSPSTPSTFNGIYAPSTPYSLVHWELQPQEKKTPQPENTQESSSIVEHQPSSTITGQKFQTSPPQTNFVQNLIARASSPKLSTPQTKKLNPDAMPFLPSQTITNKLHTVNQTPTPNLLQCKSFPPLAPKGSQKKPHRNPNHTPKQQTLHPFLSFPFPPALSELHHCDTWGHTMDEIDPSKVFRVVLQNPNGIRPYKKDLKFRYSLSRCLALGIGALSIMETKLNWSGSVAYTTQKWFSQTWQFSSLSSSQAAERFSNYFQPSGSLMAVVDHWTSRVIGKGQDPYGLGRWSFTTLWGKNSTKITVITAYRVTQKNPSSAGPKTAFMQQYRAIQAEFLRCNIIGCTPDPHRQFILDLQAWISDLQAKDHRIILKMDNNDDLYLAEGSIHQLDYCANSLTHCTSHDGSLTTLAITCGLIDILSIHHSERPFPPTYIRGKKRIDYLFISPLRNSTVQLYSFRRS